ncbi:TPA: hypothetical protein ON189_004560 [Serratia marcescens]|nr:hypothetical protein [Serratia marcescens]
MSPKVADLGQHGPCPSCDGTKPFRMDDKNGDGHWICTHCTHGDGLDLVAKGQRPQPRSGSQRSGRRAATESGAATAAQARQKISRQTSTGGGRHGSVVACRLHDGAERVSYR